MEISLDWCDVEAPDTKNRESKGTSSLFRAFFVISVSDRQGLRIL
jgi:hypothetical protein